MKMKKTHLEGNRSMNDDNRPRGAAGSGEIAFGDILKLLLSRLHWVLLAGVVAAALV